MKCSEIEGQRHLHTAMSQLHKKYVEFVLQSHQFILQKVFWAASKTLQFMLLFKLNLSGK